MVRILNNDSNSFYSSTSCIDSNFSIHYHKVVYTYKKTFSIIKKSSNNIFLPNIQHTNINYSIENPSKSLKTIPTKSNNHPPQKKHHFQKYTSRTICAQHQSFEGPNTYLFPTARSPPHMHTSHIIYVHVYIFFYFIAHVSLALTVTLFAGLTLVRAGRVIKVPGTQARTGDPTVNRAHNLICAACVCMCADDKFEYLLPASFMAVSHARSLRCGDRSIRAR